MKIISLSSNDCGGFKPPKGHLDTQLYPECEGTECDRDIVKKTVEKRKKKKKVEAKLSNSWEKYNKIGLNDKQLVDIFVGFAEQTRGTYKGLYKGDESNYTPQINMLNRAVLLTMPVKDESTGQEIEATPEDIKKAAELIHIALRGIDQLDEAFLTANGEGKMEKQSMTDREQLIQQIRASSEDFVIKAIKSMGEEVTSGYENISVSDIDDILSLCDDYELSEIVKRISNMRETVRPELTASKNTVIKVAKKNNTIKLSKLQWEAIGKTAGWIQSDTGGKSAGLTVEDIAKKHNVSIDKIRHELNIGTTIEMEHTKDERKASRIALDHLTELPDYYTRLQKMEEKGKKEVKEAKKSKKKSPTDHGFMDQCIKENQDKDDPGAYCAAIVDKAKGTTDWRKK